MYGHRGGLTPEIDAFAALPGAVVFEHAVAQAPWTRPAVASLFTGLRPTAHGVTTLDRRLDESATTLAEALRGAGYRTAAFSTNWHVIRETGLAQGFQEFRFDPNLHRSERLLGPVEEWLRQDAGPGASPFFLYVHALDPHASYDPPADLRARLAPEVRRAGAGSQADLREVYALRPRDRRERVRDIARLYDAEVAAADAGFGRLLRALAGLGRLDTTLIVFLADHGEAFDEHLRLGHAVNLHGESLWIPFVVKLDGQRHRADRPRHTASLAQQVDLLPTILGRLGISAPAGIAGVDLFAPAEGERVAVSHLDYERRRGLAITTARWRYIEPLSRRFGRERLLFDLEADPRELDDALEREPATAARLRTLLLEAARADYDRRLAAPAAELDEEARRGLAALGYLGGR